MRFLSPVAAIVALTVGTAAFAAPPTMHHLNVVERVTDEVVALHGGKADDNLGDLTTFTNDIYDATNTRKLGHDEGTCVRLVVGKSLQCRWTLVLPRGQIMVDGPVYDGIDSDMAITGGTGAWAGARGGMKIHPRDAKPSGYDFHYTLM